MGQAVLDPLPDDFGQQRMRAEGSGHEIADPRVALGRLGSQVRDVTLPVAARPEKERCDHHDRAPGRHAGIERSTDRRLGQLHMRRLHRSVHASLTPFLDKGLVVPVGFFALGPVIDDHDPKLVASRNKATVGSGHLFETMPDPRNRPYPSKCSPWTRPRQYLNEP